MPDVRGAGLDVEAVERAIVAAVAPPDVEEWNGWLLAFDDGTVSRAKSAAPLRHEGLTAGDIHEVCARYRVRGLPAMFRLPDTTGVSRLHDALAREGLHAEQPTQVQVARLSDVAAVDVTADVRIEDEADDPWCAVFLGPGFDPVDGASRVQTLRRAAGSRFASVRELDGTVVAAGVLAMGHGWASVHGMRTAASHRGRGLATSILGRLAQEAQARGFDRVMLQVEQANMTARRLYAKCGFAPAWTYLYWRP